MKTKIITPLTIASGILAVSLSANGATLINTYPTSTTSNIVATASSIETNVAVNGPDRTVIQAGFNSATGEHGNSTQQSWRTAQAAESLTNAWIQWDLGASYVVDRIQLWNFNDSSRYAAGVRQVDIYFSNVLNPGDPEIAGAGNGDNWTLWKADGLLAAGPGTAGYTGFDLETQLGSTLPATAVRYVRFEVDSTFRSDAINLGGGANDGTNVAALAQIEFYAADGIPEPSAAILGVLGFIALLRRRRA